jgi:hypothetical protein
MSVLCALVMSWAVVSSQADPTEAELEVGLERVQQLLVSEAWSEAHDELMELVEAHAETDYVLFHVHRIKDALKRCAFWTEYERPESEELMAGDILALDKRSGKLKVRYRREKQSKEDEDDEEEDDDSISEVLRDLIELLGIGDGVGQSDFTFWGGVPMHPVFFSGPYTVEIKGTMPAEDDIFGALFAVPEMVINCGDEGSYRINFGYPQHAGSWYRSASMYHWFNGKWAQLDEDDGTPLKLAKSYTVKVIVSNSTITASANGRTFLKGKKKGKSYGQFGFKGCPNVTELTINGQANTAWLEGLADKWYADTWDEFDQDYDATSEFSEALAERVGKTEKPPETILEGFPGRIHPKHQVHIKVLEKHEKKRDFTAMLRYLDSLKKGSATLGFTGYIGAQCHWMLGDLEDAIERIQPVCAEYDQFAPANLLHARCLAALGRETEAMDLLGTFIDANEDADAARVEVARMLARNGEFGRAEESLRSALAAEVPAAALEDVAFMLTTAQEGPGWSQPTDYESRNYAVRSDIDGKVCAEASKVLEQALSMYERLFGRPKSKAGDPERYEVYLFSGQAGYLTYTRHLFGSAAGGTAGVYSPVLKQLLIWNLPDRSQMMSTIRHEGFHQFLDRAVEATLPSWFNEGTAEYFETAALSRGKMTPGTPVLGHVTALNEKGVKWIDLKDLIASDRVKFYSDPGNYYAQSWAFVHYLLETGRKERTLYQSYFDGLVAGGSQQDVGEQVFGDIDMKALQRDVKQHIKELGEDLR